MGHKKLTKAELVKKLETLRHSEEKFRSLFEYGPDFIHFVDPDGIIMDTNPATIESWGYKKEELVGRKLTDFISSSSQRICATEFPNLLEKGCNRTDVQVKCKDGRIISVECSASAIYGDQGNIKYFILIQRDITERTRAHKALQFEHDRLEMVTQNVGVGVAVISRDYRTLWANAVVKQIYGDVEGKVCYEAYNRRTEVCPGCAAAQVFESGTERAVCEQIGKDVNGNIVHARVISTPIRNEQGNITAALEMIVPMVGQTGNMSVLNGIDTDSIVGDKWQELDGIKGEFVRFLTHNLSPRTAPQPANARWLSLSEIAKHLGIHEQTVYKWIKRKDMPAHKVGRLWKFRQHEIDEWMKSEQQ